MILHIKNTYQLNSIYESIKLQLVLKRFIDKLPLTDTDIEILSVFCIHGINQYSYDLVNKMKIYKNYQSIPNTVSKLIKNGIILKKGKQKIISPSLDLPKPSSTEDKILLTIKAGNK